MGRRNSGAILPFFSGFPIFRPILNLSFPWKRSGLAGPRAARKSVSGLEWADDWGPRLARGSVFLRVPARAYGTGPIVVSGEIAASRAGTRYGNRYPRPGSREWDNPASWQKVRRKVPS